jgi:hypothetical protein
MRRGARLTRHPRESNPTRISRIARRCVHRGTTESYGIPHQHRPSQLASHELPQDTTVRRRGVQDGLHRIWGNRRQQSFHSSVRKNDIHCPLPDLCSHQDGVLASLRRSTSHNGVNKMVRLCNPPPRRSMDAAVSEEDHRHARISSWPGETFSNQRPNTFAQTCLLDQSHPCSHAADHTFSLPTLRESSMSALS